MPRPPARNAWNINLCVGTCLIGAARGCVLHAGAALFLVCACLLLVTAAQ
jgi:hypothetical protein